MATTDPVNGAALLMADIEQELEETKHKKNNNKEALILKSLLYILQAIPNIRVEIASLKTDNANLKSHDIVQWVMNNPKLAVIAVFLIGFVNSLIEWSGVGKAISIAFMKSVFGVDIPLVLNMQ